jgi:argininosuccinate lyase
LPIDPAGNAADLGFARVFDNSLDAVSDRDFVAEALFDLALIGVHLSRIGEEWVLWTTEEFGFAVLDDAFATGSSMLPQKKNADIAELARGKAGRLIGNLTGLLTTLKGLPLAYNRDLQEDKEGLFDSVDQVNLAVAALTGMIATATFVPGRMQAAADADVTAATDLAEYLVRQGTPFRDAHAIVGQLVRRHLAGEGGLAALAAEAIDADAAALVRPGVGVQQRMSPGAAGPVPHGAQRTAYQEMLTKEHDELVRRGS